MHQRPHVNAWKMIAKSRVVLENFAELGIQRCWLSLPELLTIFAAEIIHFRDAPK
jgi:hypothetical protein